ncbi:MAG: bifunctional pyr operon transcriptional regulator/uracil phosphoribosyltransferase PyrR [Candidatus Cloacimonetes bacterium]|nr:bifunctional pyr operon transcriptional regulator/uracil phosphoribosyltransferase PyrR [Candidatus Cloacimonadota bacterium]MBS3768129.1 bifunctional pyr operon transcriptional regulator/uracil phosphoribosyltransferase PyrR [Candidatus Cloacimonadota bacterium]
MELKRIIMDEKSIERAIKRIAFQIIEKNKGLEDICLVGIRTRGVPMAKKLANYLREIENKEVPMGILDITLYRDDLSKVAEQPLLKGSEIGFDVEGKSVIIIDDVLYTGRTVRAAISGLLDFGRPDKIELCVLIDRGHHEMPVKADYVGKYVPTSQEEVIKVTFHETDEDEKVRIYLKK